MDLKNVYFVIGTSCAGRSTLVRNLAKKHKGIEPGEDHHDVKLPELDKNEFPNLCCTRDLTDWHEFIRRTPEEYVTWLSNVKKECGTVELMIPEELLKDPGAREKKIFVDTNIHPETGITRFFDRPDREKQFLCQLMLEEPDPGAALSNYREILRRVCSRKIMTSWNAPGSG